VTPGGSVVLGPAVHEFVCRVGPTAWVVLELMVAHDDGSIARVSARSIAGALGISKDAAARALRVLLSTGLMAQLEPQRQDGRFAEGGSSAG